MTAALIVTAIAVAFLSGLVAGAAMVRASDRRRRSATVVRLLTARHMLRVGDGIGSRRSAMAAARGLLSSELDR